MIKLLCLRIRYWPASEIVRKSHDDKNIVCYTITMRMIRLNKNSLFFSFNFSLQIGGGEKKGERETGVIKLISRMPVVFLLCLSCTDKKAPPRSIVYPGSRESDFPFHLRGEIAGRTERQKNNLFPPVPASHRGGHTAAGTLHSHSLRFPPLPHKFSPPSWTFQRLFPSPFSGARTLILFPPFYTPLFFANLRVAENKKLGIFFRNVRVAGVTYEWNVFFTRCIFFWAKEVDNYRIFMAQFRIVDEKTYLIICMWENERTSNKIFSSFFIWLRRKMPWKVDATSMWLPVVSAGRTPEWIFPLTPFFNHKKHDYVLLF